MTATESPEVKPDLLALWLPLLRDLTTRFPSWAVWKNPESAFSGPGDIDSLAPPEQWHAIESAFKEWASTNRLRPIIVCRHVPQGPHFVTFHPDWPHMLILDVKELSTWRGSTLIDFRDLPEVSDISREGFRRMRPGAEGVVKLLLNGVLPGGRPNHQGLDAKRVRELLTDDPEGTARTIGRMGRLAGPLARGVEAYLDGGWDRRSMLAVEVGFGLRALTEPRVAASRLIFKYRLIKQCDVLQSVRKHARSVPDQPDEWLRRVALNHEVDLGR